MNIVEKYRCGYCIHLRSFWTTGRHHCVVYNKETDLLTPCYKCEKDGYMNFKLKKEYVIENLKINNVEVNV